MNIEDMTLEQLQQLKTTRYANAVTDGTFEKIASVARVLGRELNDRFGPKYEWVENGVRIYIDDYGHYLTVFAGDKEVASTHKCDTFIIPGGWLDIVLAYYPEAKLAIESGKKSLDEARRALLMAQIA